ncbi:hypothetical protein RhiirA1_412905 [Rhizophagus irregularis]|uniref:Uncharacterized protein n=1 Tax=Rhizophagus irregularis TaxID=588596 RepID=A0A2N0S7X7_9GLOM|nr:hypothetical protein RhiirA1_412905 [Rhizophagus irregularis]
MHKLQYEYTGIRSNGEKKYAILDPSKKYSVISLNRLIKDGIDINNLSLKSIFLPEETKVVVKVELNLLIGKERIEEEILVNLSEESKEEFYLGNDFLSSYSIEKIGNSTTKYYEIETNKNFYFSVEECEKSPKKLLNFFTISLIIAVFAVIIFNYQFITDLLLPSVNDEKGIMLLTRQSSNFNVSEFIMNAEELGHEIDSFKLPSKEMMKQNIKNCYSLANKFDQIMVIRNTIPQLKKNLNDFASSLEIAENSYVKIYGDGLWLFLVFEKCIKNILDYISNKSLMTYIHRTIDYNEEKNLSRSIDVLIEALKTFCSSVKEAREATLKAESYSTDTHKQVIEARSVLKGNLSTWNKISNYVNSIIDKTGGDSLIIDDKIANIKNTSDDLKGIAKGLLNFKENLEKYSNVFHNLLANTGSLKRLEWNEHEVNKTTELLNMIKKNHENYRSKSNH